MKIAVFGYGRMGKAVEKQATSRGHRVIILDSHGLKNIVAEREIDCVIDFSHADIAPEAIRLFLDLEMPVVSGTTGINQQLPALRAYCLKSKAALCHSPNFSIGMHITFRINRDLARIMNRFPEYSPALLEVHHTGKKDSPSGTAIELAEQITSELQRIDNWKPGGGSGRVLPIESQREGDVRGIHRISYTGPHDTISLRHHALSRDGFAAGAVLAAESIAGKTGYYTFEEILGFSAQ